MDENGFQEGQLDVNFHSEERLVEAAFVLAFRLLLGTVLASCTLETAALCTSFAFLLDY